MAQRDQHKGAAARSECATTSRALIGRLRKHVRAEFDNRGLDKHCSNLLCWSGGAGRGLSWSAAPGTSLPPIPVSRA